MRLIMRLVLLAAAIGLFLFLSLSGCAGTQTPQSSQQTPPVQTPQNQTPTQTEPAPVSQPQGPGPDYTILNTTNGAGAGAGEIENSTFSEWKAPDNSITLQLPKGWQASEKQVDNCTVNWAALNPTGTSSAYMNNQIMAFKTEDAKQMYKAYGLTGIDSVPVSAYLGAEKATQQIIAPLTGASNVHITYQDAATSQQFSQAGCISGLAACDAKMFEAAYQRNNVLMRGKYFVQTYDFGEGTTWWINIWGYTSPAAEWGNSSATLEKIFTSVKYTDEWTARCTSKGADANGIIKEVIENRQAASDKAAEGWDKYIRGE